MAQIRVERARRIGAWVWVVAAVILVIAAVLLLDWAGYINLPFRVGAGPADPAALAVAFAALRRRH
jgi:hypothetical protein